MNESTAIKLFQSAILMPLLLFFEPYEALVKAIGLLVIIDILTGVIVARKSGLAVTSKRFWERKGPTVVLFLVGLAAARTASPLLEEFGVEAHQAGKWFCAFYGAYEFFSILENLGKLGLPVASHFSKLLQSKLPEQVQSVSQSETVKD